MIDSADDLETSAANALLKNLEEPPPSSVLAPPIARMAITTVMPITATTTVTPIMAIIMATRARPASSASPTSNVAATAWPLVFSLGIVLIGAATFQNSALSWSADHRAHHGGRELLREPLQMFDSDTSFGEHRGNLAQGAAILWENMLAQAAGKPPKKVDRRDAGFRNAQERTTCLLLKMMSGSSTNCSRP